MSNVLELECNFMKCRSGIAKNGQPYAFLTFSSAELGAFDVFYDKALEYPYLTPCKLSFEFYVYNGKPGIRLKDIATL